MTEVDTGSSEARLTWDSKSSCSCILLDYSSTLGMFLGTLDLFSAFPNCTRSTSRECIATLAEYLLAALTQMKPWQHGLGSMSIAWASLHAAELGCVRQRQ